ncbi:hypothetical protein EYC84_008136 [Monilinia fructicola]|uniref:Uncharacterized protein n=1 Tax=Monilinia fructicola TaxID=38448 RepID=A0A5M9JH49_MONFR|nr:hypothetical protein EYC84_008136 [Monilinia fructicola]
MKIQSSDARRPSSWLDEKRMSTTAAPRPSSRFPFLLGGALTHRYWSTTSVYSGGGGHGAGGRGSRGSSNSSSRSNT